MDFDTWMADAWNRHADDPVGAYAQLADTGAQLAGDDAAVDALLRLAHHVAGAHLGQAHELAEGRALLGRLGRHAAAGDAARASAALYDRSLALTGGDTAATQGLSLLQAVRVRALAAANLADRDAPRAAALLTEAVDTATASSLPDTDPAVRALAVAGNNIAAALAERPSLNDAERQLMMQAAQIGLQFWRRAGTWLEEERAFYRLALCALAAGDATQARQHAQACLDIVAAQGDVALEAFFGQEALARAEAALGHAAGLAAAQAQHRAAFDRLADDDRGWCRDTLAQVEALVSATLPTP